MFGSFWIHFEITLFLSTRSNPDELNTHHGDSEPQRTERCRHFLGRGVRDQRERVPKRENVQVAGILFVVGDSPQKLHPEGIIDDGEPEEKFNDLGK